MGGAEREVYHLAEEFKRRGWSVAAISMLVLESPIADLQKIGVETLSLGMRKGLPDPRTLVAMGRFLRRWRPDVLHAHMVHANLLARLSRLVAPAPLVISTIHNENEGAQWRYIAYRLTDRLSDVTTTVSEVAQVAATRRGAAPAGSIAVVPNGLKTAPYASDAAVRARTRSALDLGDRFTWLTVGRLVPEKGYPDMFAAFRRALERYPTARLLIAGKGRLEDEIRREASQRGLAGSVQLLGLRPDVPELMQAADAFVMTSLWEGLPMVLLEAGASGLPVVATDVGGTRDAVLDGLSGHITPPGSPDATARALESVMGMSQADRQAMGAAGRRHVHETFEIRAVADAWEPLYRQSKRLQKRGS